MVFNFENWFSKAYDCEDSVKSEEYYQQGEAAREDLFNEYGYVFKPRYNDPEYRCQINESYLERVVLPELLKGNQFIPPEFWRYILKHYPMHRDKLFELRELQYNNGMAVSVCGGGLKMIETGISDKEALMFEVWEFTLTYPEYKDLFVEEWIEG